MTRWIALSCTLLLSGFAGAQANGQATVVSGYATTGVYSLPGIPLVTTPSITLEPTALQMEADSAANGNLDTSPSPNQSVSFELGAARSQDSYGAAELASRFRPAKAAKIYTNQDVAQVNATNGLVKFANKTEHL